MKFEEADEQSADEDSFPDSHELVNLEEGTAPGIIYQHEDGTWR
jgi:hypothetical protein